MRTMATIPLLVLSLVGVACGPKVETPFEGHGRYEGQYTGRSPEGWGESRAVAERSRATEEERQARREEEARPLPEEPVGPLGTDGQEPVAEPYVPRPVATEEIRQLRADVDDVRASTDPAHPELVGALRHLAVALSMLSPSEQVRANIDSINRYADRIEQSDPNSLEHADWAKAALIEGTNALTSISASAGVYDTMQPQISAVRARVDALQNGVALLKQTPALADALGQMTDAVAAYDERSRPQLGTY